MTFRLLAAAIVLATGIGGASAQEVIDGSHEGIDEMAVTDLLQQGTRDFVDPQSAQFRDLHVMTSKPGALCGRVNSRNSFGGYVGFKPFYWSGGDEPRLTVAGPTRINEHADKLKAMIFDFSGCSEALGL